MSSIAAQAVASASSTASDFLKSHFHLNKRAFNGSTGLEQVGFLVALT
jgi:hypothetical protein